MVAHLCNSSPWKAEAGGLKAYGQPGLHSQNLFQNYQAINIMMKGMMVTAAARHKYGFLKHLNHSSQHSEMSTFHVHYSVAFYVILCYTHSEWFFVRLFVCLF